MDINTIRSIVTVVTFLVFIGIVLWAWSSRNAKSFEEAAQMPFKHDENSPK
jgi:cytochrome c oxidase cbb3-type subunit IV